MHLKCVSTKTLEDTCFEVAVITLPRYFKESGTADFQ